MKIVANGIPLLRPLTGVGQYTRQIFSLISRQADIDLSLFYGFGLSKEIRTPLDSYSSSLNKSFSFARKFLPFARVTKGAIQTFAFQYHVGKESNYIYHEPNFLPLPYAGPKILTIHDLSCFDLPETHPAERVRLIQKELPAAMEHAAHLIVVANCTKTYLQDRFSIPSDRISVTPLASDPSFRPMEHTKIAPNLAQLGLEPGAYILAVGTLEPRKNLGVLFQAYEKLPPQLRKKFPLVLAGMPGWLQGAMMRSAQDLINRGEIIILGYVPHMILPMLYAGASVFVYPSRYEGFGLPPLEAMASGIPVITSNRTSLPEVVGDAGILLDPDDVDGFSTSIRQLIDDRKIAKKLSEQGQRRANEFSWKRCASETVEVYNRVARECGLDI